MVSPTTLLLARYDAAGHLRLIARTTPLPTAVRRDLGQRLHPVRFVRLRGDLTAPQVPPFGT